jgi:uridine kinase
MTAMGAARAETLERLAAALVVVAHPSPLLVAIDGRTAAGKTTLADELVAPIERLGRPTIRIGIDDFHLPRAERRQRGCDLPAWQSYYLHAFDYPAIRAALLPLRPSGDRWYRRARFDLLHDTPIVEQPRLAPADAVVLVDGVFLYRPELDDLWNMRLFVDVDAADTLRRGPPRDVAWHGAVDAAIPAYENRYIPGEEHYLALIDPRGRADIIVDNRDPANPKLFFQGAKRYPLEERNCL